VNLPPNLYRRHRFPGEVISHCVWLYYRFSLSYRDIELMMAERGVVLTYETVRDWCLKFGPYFANELNAGIARRSVRNGIWTKSSLRSTASSITSGGQWIRTGSP
jgi:transposase-like protein